MTDQLSNPRRPSRRGIAATSADVAQLAGVSRATVSYVLNGSSKPITEETRLNVRAAAEKLGYRPNLAAKSLAEGGSRLVLIELPSSAFGASTFDISRALASALARHGLISTTHFESPDRGELIQVARDLRPRAVVSMQPFEPSEERRLTELGVQVISSERDPSTGLDSYEDLGSEMRLGHLVERGHTLIGIAEGNLASREWWTRVRRESLLRTCRKLGLPDPSVMQFDAGGIDAKARVADWHRMGVTGVVAYNDEVAEIVLYGIREAGLRCPDDLAVIGEDDMPGAAVSAPPLTTVASDAQAAAAISARLVLTALGIDETEVPLPSTVLSLVVRSST